MIRFISRNIVRFILLVLLQVFIFNNIQLGGFINPYFYILFILLLPFETPRLILIISGFIIGITVDAFANTMGIHASATVFMAFVRPYALNLFAPRDDYDPNTLPRIRYYGLNWFLKYTAFLVLAHHLFLFYIEVFTFSDFFNTLWRCLLSCLLSIVLIILSQYLIYKK